MIPSAHLQKAVCLLALLLSLAGCPAGGGGDGLLLPPGATSTAGVSCSGTAWPFASSTGTGAHLADTVKEAPGATGSGFGDSSRAVNSICGQDGVSSLDVYSLDSSASSTDCVPNEKCIVVEWSGRRVLNVASQSDFIVFENPFDRSATARFIEAVIVEVSEDAADWCGWSPVYTGETNSGNAQFSIDIFDPTKYSRLAGVEKVLFYQSTWTDTAADVFDSTKGGGDHFDLDDGNFGSSGTGCSTTVRDALRTSGFVYVRLTTANSRNSAGFPLPTDSFDQTADIDGVVARNVQNR